VSPTETSSTTKREIEVEIPAADVARETETLIQKYQKLARIPGFRAGHAPASIIKQRFAEGIKSDVVEALVPRYFRKETDKLGLTPVSQPRVSDLHVHDGEPLRFKASFEVMPAIRVEAYKELRADKPDISVTDEEVELALKNLQEQRATFTAIEGSPLGDGDFAQVSLDGKPKDAEGAVASPASTKPGPAGSNPVHMDDILVEIGGKGTMPEFTENLRGASAGDERTFDVHYPQDFSDQRLAGKTFTYTVISRTCENESAKAWRRRKNITLSVKLKTSWWLSWSSATTSKYPKRWSNTRSISVSTADCARSRLRA
jgi:trigger factor